MDKLFSSVNFKIMSCQRWSLPGRPGGKGAKSVNAGLTGYTYM